MSSSDASDSSTLSHQYAISDKQSLTESDNGSGDLAEHGKKTVFVALVVNMSIGLIKFIAGSVGHHSSMLSEAMHSFADAINSGFLLVGLQKGSRAADKTHPFGYGLETTLWSLLASLFMLLLAGWSMYLGVERLVHPQAFHGYWPQAIVLLISIGLEIMALDVASKAVLNEIGLTVSGWGNRITIAAKHVRQITSPTTRFVYYEDSLAFLGAVVALLAISISQFGVEVGLMSEETIHIPDACASILIGLMILSLSIFLFIQNSKGLTGAAASPQKETMIRDLVLNTHGVSQILELKTLDYGLSGVLVQLRLEVNPDIPVKDVDDLTERVRDKVISRIDHVKEVIIEVLADETDVEWSDKFYRLIEQGKERQVLKSREEQILRNVYDFTNAVVQDIMIPRTDVDCIDVTASIEELLRLIVDCGHTRIPVYRDDVDNMMGVVHAKDVFEHVLAGKLGVSVETLVRELDVYPENKAVSDLLEDFKRKKIQMVMVADEHGGFAGIVTLEDLLEEIVGEMWDEYDEEEEMVEQPEPTRLVLNGRYDIEDINERYDLNIPDTDFNTVGGFVFGLLGRSPDQGDSATFEDMVFTVLEVSGHRVDKVQIVAPTPFKVVNNQDSPAAPEV